jgi:molecular chaperone HscB
MNYFELFDIPISFFPEISELKKKYHKLSFEFHPDFHRTVSEEIEEKILDKSTEINEAYLSLLDENKRFEYILSLLKALPEEGKAQIPQEFLMEMMDLNEELMELKFEPDEIKQKELAEKISDIQNKLYSEIEPIMKSFDFQTISIQHQNLLVDFLMKKKYLLRLKQNLFNFAPR